MASSYKRPVPGQRLQQPGLGVFGGEPNNPFIVEKVRQAHVIVLQGPGGCASLVLSYALLWEPRIVPAGLL